ncbi:hypothetical protein ACC686_35745, partial [Rhizobium johnstonii]
NQDVVIVGLPLGGVPVALEIAKVLYAISKQRRSKPATSILSVVEHMVYRPPSLKPKAAQSACPSSSFDTASKEGLIPAKANRHAIYERQFHSSRDT